MIGLFHWICDGYLLQQCESMPHVLKRSSAVWNHPVSKVTAMPVMFVLSLVGSVHQFFSLPSSSFRRSADRGCVIRARREFRSSGRCRSVWLMLRFQHWFPGQRPSTRHTRGVMREEGEGHDDDDDDDVHQSVCFFLCFWLCKLNYLHNDKKWTWWK